MNKFINFPWYLIAFIALIIKSIAMSFGIPDALAIIGLLAFEGWNRHCLAKTHKLEVEQIEALMKDVEQRTITHVDTIVGDLRNKVGAMSMVRSVR